MNIIARVVFILSLTCVYGQDQVNGAGPAQTSAPEPAPVWLKYAVLDSQADLVPCGASFSESRDAEITNGLQTFPEIQKDPELFQTIAARLGFREKAQFDDDEKLVVYYDYKKLQAMHLKPWGDKYRVTFTHEGDTGGQADNDQGGFSVDRSGYVTGIFGGGGTVIIPTTSRPLRDIQPEPEVKHSLEIKKIDMLDLRYQLIDHFSRAFPCVILRIPENFVTEIEAFPEIQKQSAMYDRIIRHLGFTQNGSFSEHDKRMVYKEYSRLAGIELRLLATKYQFHYGAYIGLIDGAGRIEVVRTSTRSGCPG